MKELIKYKKRRKIDKSRKSLIFELCSDCDGTDLLFSLLDLL